MGISQDLYEKAKKLIPGGTQLLSKRPEMFLPDYWPAYYSEAKGCRVKDLDGNEYRDMCLMGIGANILGYCDEDVDKAVLGAVMAGSMCTLNAPEEVELAELLLDLHPWADQVRYAKTGGEALSIAVRIARAYTNKDIVLVCGYHGWSDWYLAANLEKGDPLSYVHLSGLEPKGVPQGLADTNYIFEYNNIGRFKELIEKYGEKISAVVMEPIRNSWPQNNFLNKIREITKEKGIVLIFDEVSAGFRLTCGGSHKLLGVEPDMMVMAKAISNGYPMSAILGKRDIMEAAQNTFISSTYWTEKLGLAAAIATIKKYKKNSVETHLDYIGKQVKKGWKSASDKAEISIEISGINPLAHFEFIYENPLEYKTCFTQEMLKRGFLATNVFYACYAHTGKDVKDYISAVEEVFLLMKKTPPKEILKGSVCHSGFQRIV